MSESKTPDFKAHKAPSAKSKPASAKAPKGAPVTQDKLEKAAAEKAQEKAKSHAEKALKEAEARKADEDQKAKEIGGPDGPEPTRYGDWERKGIAYDF